jgi:hypothetical protein
MTTEERLERLEKELAGAKRRSRVMLVATVMTIAGMFLLCAGGNAVQKSIRAQSFELVDRNGMPRGGLTADTSGEPCLLLLNRNGKTSASLTAIGGEPRLRLYDQNDTLRALLDVLESGLSGLFLGDRNGKLRAVVDVTDVGPALTLYDQNDKVISHAP